MPQRAKPFSTKQKRVQLQAKHARKRDQAAAAAAAAHGDGVSFNSASKQSHVIGDDDDGDEHSSDVEESGDRDPAASSAASASQSTSSARIAASLFQLDSLGRSAGPQGMVDRRTFFRRETRGEIDERKRAATLPFARLPPSSLELTAAALHTSEAVELPKRPPWSATETKAALDARETAAFERWLEGVYARHSVERMNYFEHNLEVWRQLWRTVEMSDVLLLLADIRHPFFHFPVALYRAAVLEARKPLVLVLNKIDLVAPEVVQQWVAFFRWRYPALAAIVSFSTQAVMYTEAELKEIRGYKKAPKRLLKKATTVGADALMDALAQIPIAGKSIDWRAAKDAIRAYQETKGQAFQPAAQQPARRAAQQKSAGDDIGSLATASSSASASASASATASTAAAAIAAAEFDFEAMAAEADAEAAAEEDEVDSHPSSARLNDDNDNDDEDDNDDDDDADGDGDGDHKVQAAIRAHLAALQLGLADEAASDASGAAASMITVGLIGHPNVGKSSLINGMVSRHVVSTSRTPGHTKYYQHIPITRELRLMDCPGLVFPAADVPKALQVLMGIYPIAQVAEPFSAVQFLAERVPIDAYYGLKPDPDNVSAVEGGSGSGSGSRGGGKASARYSDDDEDDDDDGESRGNGGNRKKCGKKRAQGKQQHATVASEHRWSAYELCEALAVKKSLLASKGGRPDLHRAANFILRDAFDGRIVLAFRPPPRDKWSQLPNAAPVEPETDTAANEDEDDEHADNYGNIDGASGKKNAHPDGSDSDSDSAPSRPPTSTLLKSKKAAKKAARKQAQSLQHDEPQLSIDEDFDRVARRRQHAAEKRMANQGGGAGGRKGGGGDDDDEK